MDFLGILQMEVLGKLLKKAPFVEMLSFQVQFVINLSVDFSTGDDPRPIFQLQKEYNAPGKSPPLCAEFYTGWLTHWGENIASTGADFTAAALDKILSLKGSAVLYMAHGGTNFGFYNGANTGADELDYKPDLTSYDYDAPIRESGDVDNAKFKGMC
ncbi:Beta-galactosidase 17 [Vitis vinifera]|uniref:beta-galactosidase n=1 Tax=Vitis vinifera TaxID=29760 RepID=A0A438EWC5_VITVI|nr:Beta-galactosidase 17 [Vitis vinifera]